MANLTCYDLFDDMLGDLAEGYWRKPVTMPGASSHEVRVPQDGNRYNEGDCHA